MRHIFGFLRNARRHFQNAREGVPDAPFSRNCARSGSTVPHRGRKKKVLCRRLAVTDPSRNNVISPPPRLQQLLPPKSVFLQ